MNRLETIKQHKAEILRLEKAIDKEWRLAVLELNGKYIKRKSSRMHILRVDAQDGRSGAMHCIAKFVLIDGDLVTIDHQASILVHLPIESDGESDETTKEDFDQFYADALEKLQKQARK